MSAIPEWPKLCGQARGASWWHENFDAALARLRVIKVRGYMKHLHWCDIFKHPGRHEAPLNLPCSCGLDELLADLLPGGE